MIRVLQLLVVLSLALLAACGVDPSLINGDHVNPVFIFAGQVAEGSTNTGDGPAVQPRDAARNGAMSAVSVVRADERPATALPQRVTMGVPAGPAMPAPRAYPAFTPY